MRSVRLTTIAAAAFALVLPLGASSSAVAAPYGLPTQPPAGEADTLRAAAPEGFFIGTAVAGGGHHLEQDYPDPFTYDEEYRQILGEQFNSVSPENQM